MRKRNVNNGIRARWVAVPDTGMPAKMTRCTGVGMVALTGVPVALLTV